MRQDRRQKAGKAAELAQRSTSPLCVRLKTRQGWRWLDESLLPTMGRTFAALFRSREHAHVGIRTALLCEGPKVEASAFEARICFPRPYNSPRGLGILREAGLLRMGEEPVAKRAGGRQ